jgi:hypothetical protein
MSTGDDKENRIGGRIKSSRVCVPAAVSEPNGKAARAATAAKYGRASRLQGFYERVKRELVVSFVRGTPQQKLEHFNLMNHRPWRATWW